jgi:hypothetical protein
VSTDRPASPGLPGPVSRDEHGAPTAISPEAAAQADLLAFGDEVDAFGGQAIKPPRPRGPGRPPGSPNRTTSRIRELLLARGYRDPLEQAAALVSGDPREIAAALAKKKVEDVTFGEALAVLAEQGKARGQLLPYFHQEMPKVKEPEREAPRVMVVIADSPEKAQQVQRVIERAAGSAGDASHGEGDAIDADVIDITDDFCAREHD